MLTQNGISQEEQKQHPQAVVDVVNFYKDNAEKSEEDAIWDKMGPAHPQGYAYQANLAPNYNPVQPLSPPQSLDFHGTTRLASRTPAHPLQFLAVLRRPSLIRLRSTQQLWYPTDQHPGLRALLQPLPTPFPVDPHLRPQVPSSRSSQPRVKNMISLRSPMPLQHSQRVPVAHHRRPVAGRTPREGHRHVSILLQVLPPCHLLSNTSSSNNKLWPWPSRNNQRLLLVGA